MPASQLFTQQFGDSAEAYQLLNVCVDQCITDELMHAWIAYITHDDIAEPPPPATCGSASVFFMRSLDDAHARKLSTREVTTSVYAEITLTAGDWADVRRTLSMEGTPEGELLWGIKAILPDKSVAVASVWGGTGATLEVAILPADPDQPKVTGPALEALTPGDGVIIGVGDVHYTLRFVSDDGQ